MNRIPSLARPCALLFLAATFAVAQQPAPEAAPAAPKDEIHELRQAVEQQNRQLEALTRLVTEIRNRLPAASPAQPSTPAPPSAPDIGTPPPAATTSPAAAPATVAAASPSPQVPKPETAGAEGSKHTVAKGETLTSIAKRYNIPLAELEKANKITDERKLQIGQVLNIPTAANKTPETPTEKKETP